MLPAKSFTAGTRRQPAIHPPPSSTSVSISANHNHPTHSKPFDEKSFEHRRKDLNPQSRSDFIAAPSRARRRAGFASRHYSSRWRCWPFTPPRWAFNFIGFDDTDILKHRYFIIGDLSKIKLAFTTDAFLGTNGSFYRPLQTVSFMLDALIGGPSPFIYHFTNLVLYIVGSLCVFWLLLTLGYQRLSSLLLALLFALHPMFVPMVAWVPTRGDLLLTIFVIVSFVLFIKSFRANRPGLVVWHGITFFLAFLSKETAVAVPALCLLYYYFELRKTKARKLIKRYFVAWLIAGARMVLSAL